MKSQILDTVIDEARERADAFEIYARESTGLSANHQKGKFHIFEREAFHGVSARTVRDGKIGFATAAGPEATRNVVDTALRIAPWGGEFDYTFAEAAPAVVAEQYDPRIEKLTPDDISRIGANAKALLGELAPEAAYMGGVSCSYGRARIVTSAGQDVIRRGTSFGFYAGAELNSEGDFLTVYEQVASNKLIDAAAIETCVRRVASEFHAARVVTPLKAGKYRVMFTPGCLSDILTPIKVSVNGTNIDKKLSRWGESLGKQVLDSRISLTDDPSHAEGPGSSVFDGEGMPTRVRSIIQDGVLTGFIHSRMTAAHCGHEPTGNGQRGVESIARPGFHNLVMAGGEMTLDQMTEELGEGLLIEDLIGVFTSNFLAGQCSGGIMLGYLVRDGKRVGRVKNAAINVNTFDLLNGALVGLSKDRKWTGGQLLPWALVDGVQVSSR